MSKIAWVFPGQGSQTIGMGKDLADQYPEAKAVFEEADDALGDSISKVCFEGPDDALMLTENTQPAVLTVSMAVHAVFSKRAENMPHFVAGHSLGEYSALVASGAMSFRDAVRSVRARGQLMQKAVPNGVGAMAAILGLAREKVVACCAQAAQTQVVSAANFNEPNQTVIAGNLEAVERAITLLQAAGARRAVKLPVSAPFHCALMQPVVEDLDVVLSTVAFRNPKIPVVTNVEAAPNSDASRIKSLLLQQVTGSVRWVETIQKLDALGVTRLIELGPGKVLAGLSKRISKSIECHNIEDVASLEKALTLGKFEYELQSESSTHHGRVEGHRPGVRA